MSEYKEVHKKDENGVSWVKVEYVNKMFSECYQNEIKSLRAELDALNKILGDDGYTQCDKCESFAVNTKSTGEGPHGEDPFYSYECVNCGHVWHDA